MNFWRKKRQLIISETYLPKEMFSFKNHSYFLFLQKKNGYGFFYKTFILLYINVSDLVSRKKTGTSQKNPNMCSEDASCSD